MNNSYKKETFCLNVVAIIISIFALVISIRSCVLSKQSLEFANRPYLTIKPVKFKDTDSYLKITVDYDKLSLSVKTYLEMTNLGKTPAKNVLCPENAFFTFQGQNKEIPFKYVPFPNSNIGPGDTQPLTSDVTMLKRTRQAIQADVEGINSGKGFIILNIPITYSSILDSSKKYSTVVRYKIYKDKIELIKSEIE
jgi:hypothetical protein